MTYKIVGVKVNNYFNWRRGQTTNIPLTKVVETSVETDIKSIIVDMLFTGVEKFNYVLVKFKTIVYIVERDGDKSYVKREITYHPLMNLVQ